MTTGIVVVNLKDTFLYSIGWKCFRIRMYDSDEGLNSSDKIIKCR